MNTQDETIYRLLLWSMPILLSILSFVGLLAVKSLISLANDVNEIKITIARQGEKHDSLEKRVDKLEVNHKNKKQ